MLDLIIQGGSVVDGSGAPRRRADVGFRDGRIAAIGTIDEPARETVPAAGKIVAPGFIDVHTHYDAQAFWDGTLSPSLFHDHQCSRRIPRTRTTSGRTTRSSFEN